MIKWINIFLLFLLAPVVGFYFAFFQTNPVHSFDTEAAVLPMEKMESTTKNIEKELSTSQTTAVDTKNEVKSILKKLNKEKEALEAQQKKLNELVAQSKEQTNKSDIVLEQILSNLLGEPIGVTKGNNSTTKVYSLIEAGYRGYMAKVSIHDQDALKVVLADDKVVSNGETTSHAAQRHSAVLGVNAGGFWKTNGQLAPLGITVVDGKIKTFYNHPSLSFVGFNTQGHLVGGKITKPNQVKERNILQGASFVPTLLQDGKKMPIPRKWAQTRHPRTIVGNFSNGELLFIVIDGRRKGWSSGVTLEELQDKLLSFKIKDAFNLDGGGSSAFYYNGKILNKPSDGRQRPVTSNIIILK
ncbi:phosphodiester glycosidase family protein [Bacillus tianshenii]|nr:phosphodiester glycosidase family protein [Bacillus tianshenii]